MFDILKTLFNQAGLIAILAFVISQSSVVREILNSRQKRKRDVLLIVTLFSTLGILGTYTGIPVNGAIANSRVVGVFVAGLIGGPQIGFLTGFVAGFHRWTIDVGGFTAFTCMLSTIIEGLLGGILCSQMQKVENKWFFATVAGAGAEILQMLMILTLVRPFPDALNLVEIIGIPMVGANALAIGLFIAIINSVREKEDKVAANQAEVVLNIATKTIEYLRKGFNHKTTTCAAKIILANTDLSAVAFTDTKKILAHLGEGAGHHPEGVPFQTHLTEKVLKSGKIHMANSAEQIQCSNPECVLQSAVVIPLFQDKKIIGVMKLYRVEENAISKVDINMAKGLGTLFSTQIELSTIEEQSKLLGKAELKALQAQINPHFLFNAINTISSFIRTDPESARKLLQNLSQIFRNSLQSDATDVSITQEIKHIQAYLNIEKARYGDNLNIIFLIPDNLDFTLPPFLLQPLVENAVKHGIMAKKDGGEIILTVKEERKKISITISDDGIGMEENVLNKLLTENNRDSIALDNINKRLIKKYGEKHGLIIESKPDRGTKVTVCIPREIKHSMF